MRVATSSAHLHSTCGRVIALDVPRWFDEPGPQEQALLDMAVGPVLDIGCGPGRHTLALKQRGLLAVGIDDAHASVTAARARGAEVIHRSVFDPLPAEGTWASALLLDGNVGIGGNPRRLFARSRELLRSGGRLLLELDAPGEPSRALRVQPRSERGEWLPWAPGLRFAWATLSVDDLEEVAASAGFVVDDVWSGDERWFARVDAR